MPAVSERVREILHGAQIQENTLVIPEKLDRRDYAAVNKVLTNLDGKWSRSQQAHVFDSDPTARVAEALATGEVRGPARTTEGYVPTPPELASRLVREFSTIMELTGGVVLEPSAGDGTLARAIVADNPGVEVVAVEPNAQRAARITHPAITVVPSRLEDYLHAPERPDAFQGIVMNPPFSVPGRPKIWIDHWWLAWGLLAPGARLVSVVPAGFTFREDRQHTELRAWHESVGGGSMALDEGTFAAMGTGVHALVIWADKPADAEAAPARTRQRRRGRETPEQKQHRQEERRAEDKELRDAATEALEDDEYVADLAARVARLPEGCKVKGYSDRNKALVFNQADALGVPVTGHLATYKTWKGLGCPVREGQSALRIVAVKGDEEERADHAEEGDGQAADESGDQEAKPRKRFRMTALFDWSQTVAYDPETSPAE